MTCSRTRGSRSRPRRSILVLWFYQALSRGDHEIDKSAYREEINAIRNVVYVCVNVNCQFRADSESPVVLPVASNGP